MTKQELKQRLDEEGVDERVYSLEGGALDEKLVLEERNPGTWCVYYSERGLRTGEREFGSQQEACDYMFARLTRNPTTRKLKS